MYHPTGRVLAVLEWLQSRSLVTGPEMADRLETDVRTVRRYIQKLQDVGIPIESVPGRAGGYRLRPGFRLPPLIFSEDEAVAVILGLVASPWLRLALPKDAVESTLSKITRVLPQTTWDRVQGLSGVSVVTLDPGGSRIPVATLLLLSRAAADRVCVQLEYRSRESPESTSRVVEPYGVAGFQGHWYLVGFCRLRRAPRQFRLDRIEAFEVLAEEFERPKDFHLDRYIREGLEAQPWKVHLWFDATEDQVRGVLGTLGEITPTDGGLAYVGPTADLAFTARALVFSGLAFRVLGPPELRQSFSKIADAARKAAEP